LNKKQAGQMGARANPEVRVGYPEHIPYEAAEAAELDEPGAMQALIGLKLSQTPSFTIGPEPVN